MVRMNNIEVHCFRPAIKPDTLAQKLARIEGHEIESEEMLGRNPRHVGILARFLTGNIEKLNVRDGGECLMQAADNAGHAAAPYEIWIHNADTHIGTYAPRPFFVVLGCRCFI